jgi:hypothetical protein
MLKYGKTILLLSTIIFSTLFPLNVSGQDCNSDNLVSSILQESSKLTINGSSTLHDWQVEAKEFSVIFCVPDDWYRSDNNWFATDIENLTVTVPVSELDGGKNKMNRDLRKALRFEKHPQIEFVWQNIRFEGASDRGKIANVEGRVTVAGVEQSVKFTADLSLNEWNQLVARDRKSVV